MNKCDWLLNFLKRMQINVNIHTIWCLQYTLDLLNVGCNSVGHTPIIWEDEGIKPKDSRTLKRQLVRDHSPPFGTTNFEFALALMYAKCKILKRIPQQKI